MITAIRRSFKSNFNKVILWITIIAVAGIFSIPELLKRSSSSPWVAMVNGDEVSYNDFARKATLVQERINALRAQYGEYADYFFQALGFPSDPKIMAMEQLIQETVLNQAVYNLGMHVGDAYIGEKLSNPLFVQQELSDVAPMGILDQSGINPRALHNYLRHIRLSGVEFEQKIAQALARRTLLEIVQASSYIPELELKQQFIARYVDKKYSVLIIPFKSLVKEQQKADISEHSLKDYFDKQNATSKKYFIPEKRAGIAWSFAPERYGIIISDDMVSSYYEENKLSKYASDPAKVQIRLIAFNVANEATRQATLDKAKQTREDLLNNKEKFASVAKEISSDRESAAKGGLLPAFARGEQDPVIDKAAFLLKADGDISEVIQTPKGYALVQRVSKIAPTFKSLSSVKKEITTALTQQKFNELFAHDMQDIIDQTAGDGAKLAFEMKSKGGKEEAIRPTGRNQDKWAEALFGIAQKGKATYMLDSGNGMVVQLTDVIEGYVPGLESVKDVVLNDIHEERASEQLRRKLQDALDLTKSKSLKEIQATIGGNLESIDAFSKKDAAKAEALKKRGFPVDQMLQLENIGSAADFIIDRDGYIVRLEGVDSYTESQYQDKRASLKAELDQSGKRLFVEGFVASLIRSAKIETNESLITLNEE